MVFPSFRFWRMVLVLVGTSMAVLGLVRVKTATAMFQQQTTVSMPTKATSSTSRIMSQRIGDDHPMDTKTSTSQRMLTMDQDNRRHSRRRRRRRCSPCESLSANNNNNNNNKGDDDLDLDRREATFALLGTLWAVTGVGVMSGLLPNSSTPPAAHAAYGDVAKIQLPNPLENIILRSNQGCVVESLGNRECLVYGSSDDKVYQGADGQVLVQRLQQAVVALSTIPDLITSKKWSAIQGVLTGPMGTLIATMNQLLQLQRDQQQQSSSSSSVSSSVSSVSFKAAEQLALKVKQDLFAISGAADKKLGDKVLQSQQQATADLVAFLQALEQP